MLPQDVSRAVVARPTLSGRVGLVAAAVAVLGEACWLVAGLPGAALVSDLGAMAVAAWAAVACVGVARRHPAALRRFWTLLAVTMALAALGRIMWTVRAARPAGAAAHAADRRPSSPPASSPAPPRCSARCPPRAAWSGGSGPCSTG